MQGADVRFMVLSFVLSNRSCSCPVVYVEAAANINIQLHYSICRFLGHAKCRSYWPWVLSTRFAPSSTTGEEPFE